MSDRVLGDESSWTWLYDLVVFVAGAALVGATEELKRLLFSESLSAREPLLFRLVVPAMSGLAIVALMRVLASSHARDLQAVEHRSALFSKTLIGALPVAVFFIDNILRFVEMASGSFKPSLRLLDVRGLIASVGQGFGRSARDKGIALRCDVLDQVPERVLADAELLRKVLESLVKNAIEYTNEGEVRLEVAVDGAQRLAFAVHDSGCGCGMIPAVLERLFEPFWQADGSTTRVHGGIGLGLALAKSMVEAMGGCIAATSTPSVGTSLRVLLPLRPENAPPMMSPERAT